MGGDFVSAMAQAPTLGLHPAQWLAALPGRCPTLGCAAVMQGLVSLARLGGAWQGGLGAPWWAVFAGAAGARAAWAGLAAWLGRRGG